MNNSDAASGRATTSGRAVFSWRRDGTSLRSPERTSPWHAPTPYHSDRTEQSKPRVVFLLPGYGAVNRGAERFLEQIIPRLADRFEITVLGRGPNRPGLVHIKAISRDNPLVTGLHALPVTGHAMRFLQMGPLNVEWSTACLGSLPWLIKNDFDLFVPEGGLWGGLLGRYIRHRKRVPFVDIGWGAVGRWEIAAARQRPDTYLSLTNYSLTELRRHVPDLRGVVIPIAVDTERFTPDAPPRAIDLERPVIMFVGALEKMKRPQLALEAVARLEQGSLLLVGKGPLDKELDALGQRLLGARRYQRLSASSAEMPGLYAACDVFTLPSETEAFPLTGLEALASNRPVVTQNDETRQEAVGDMGILCDCGSPDAYTQALRDAAQRKWGDGPRTRALNFSWQKTADRYAELFQRLIDQR